jgi:hypothetical protein
MTITATAGQAAWPLAAAADVHIPLVMTAAEPVSHGAGIAGNTSLLRTQDILLPSGARTAVPYVSGNSLRHRLRSALAWHLVRLLDAAPGSLPRQVTDLLWSGGALTETGQPDLALMRRVQELLPALGLLGYSARASIVAGVLYADNVHVVCAENSWRLPPSLAGLPHASLPAGAMRSDGFGTRHDISTAPAARYIALLDGDPARETTQMIYDAQLIRAGAVLWSGLHLHAPAAGHVAALATALDEAAPDDGSGQRVLQLGGRGSDGHGRCILAAGALDPLGDVTRLRGAYEERLLAGRDEVLTLLAEVTG